jgi:hypothetical protein
MLIQVISRPELLKKLTHKEWNCLISEARYSQLLSHIYYLCEEQNILMDIPVTVTEILTGDKTRNDYLHLQFNNEIGRIATLLHDKGYRIILLKGAAYLQAKLGAYKGRRFADIDLLVEKTHISDIEETFKNHRWFSASLSEYDEHYYRYWSHQIPPMKHPESGIEIDVHHHLGMPIGRIKFNSEDLFENAVPIPGSTFFRLSNEDIILHSALHLLINDETDGKLKDLVDILTLLREFDSGMQFWKTLISRSSQLNLHIPLYYALTLIQDIFTYKIPQDYLKDLEQNISVGLRHKFVNYCFRLSLTNLQGQNAKIKLVNHFLFWRAHWLRMPLSTLLVHLTRKSFIKSELI